VKRPLQLVGTGLVAGGLLLVAPAGMALADPGFGISVGGSDQLGFGDAEAKSTVGSLAVAWNGGSADASGATDNIVVAGEDSTASAGKGSTNFVYADSRSEATVKNGSNNVVFAVVDSVAEVGDGHDNHMVAAVGSTLNVQDQTSTVNAVALCGGSAKINAQSDRIVVGCLGQ
jgi:hypothetical protein